VATDDEYIAMKSGDTPQENSLDTQHQSVLPKKDEEERYVIVIK